MTTAVDAASHQGSPHTFRVFEELVPRDLLAPFDLGHRGVFSSWVVVWLMVFQRLHQNASLSRAVAELRLGAIAASLPDCKRVRDGSIPVGTGGYSQARGALPLEAAVAVTDHVARALAATGVPAWRGRRAFLLDGTTLSLAHHPELVDRFPPAENQHGRSHWPVVNLVMAHELGSGFAIRPEWGPMYGPHAVSETRLARRLLERLGTSAVVVSDRNFGIFSVARAATGLGHDVVARLKDDRWERMVAEATPIGPGQWRLQWRPGRWDRRGDPGLPADAVVVGRLIEVAIEREGRRIVLRLFTTVEEATVEALASLYGLRWRIETDVRDVKQTMELHRLSGRGVDIVSKEVLLGVVAYNLVIQVRRLAAAGAGVEPRRLSFKRVLDLVQAYCDGLATATTSRDWTDRFERLLKGAAHCRLPVRKRFRSYPRAVIARTRGFPTRRWE